MKLILDERVLNDPLIEPILIHWSSSLEKAGAAGVEGLVDSLAISDVDFLRKFNQLVPEKRQLLAPTIFRHRCWRPGYSDGKKYSVGTDATSLAGLGICESFELDLRNDCLALFGSDRSSYFSNSTVKVTCVEPHAESREVPCATDSAGVVARARAAGLLPHEYDVEAPRSPRDWETALVDSIRFEQTGRFELLGRRRVFRERDTGRMFYVDDAHSGPAAHLEVFDENGDHLGVADLQGSLKQGSQVAGRKFRL